MWWWWQKGSVLPFKGLEDEISLRGKGRVDIAEVRWQVVVVICSPVMSLLHRRWQSRWEADKYEGEFIDCSSDRFKSWWAGWPIDWCGALWGGLFFFFHLLKFGQCGWKIVVGYPNQER